MKFFSAQILKKTHSSKGFTLIELLVVIGILGILATALVATIDPFEQLKKADDANVKNTAVEFTDANIRFYTTHNALPWGMTDTSYGVPCAQAVGNVTGPNALMTLGAAGVTSSCLAELINDGELKGAFTSASGVLSNIYFVGGTNSVTACFAPQSKSQKNDANTKYKWDAASTSFVQTNACPNATATDCYWCAQ